MEDLNKTIVITYDEITRMKEFCASKEGVVTREFMDWYVNENSFFSKTGILIVERIFSDSNKKFTVAFNFNNPDYPEFSLYDYSTQKEVCKYFFSREDNLSMKDIRVKIKWFDKEGFSSEKNIFSTPKINDEINKFPIRKKDDLKGLSPKKLKSKLAYHKKEIAVIYSKICRFMAEQGVYFTYATMYYFAKNKAKEVVGVPKSELLEDGIGKQITSIYKYTGYVNINDAKIYKPVIKKEKTEPLREYGRHIEKWSVRGHYRRVGDKVIWIDAFEKGEGELEKRIYGTEKESDVNLIPKVFEVTKTICDSDTKVESEILEGDPSVLIRKNPDAPKFGASHKVTVTLEDSDKLDKEWKEMEVDRYKIYTEKHLIYVPEGKLKLKIAFPIFVKLIKGRNYKSAIQFMLRQLTTK